MAKTSVELKVGNVHCASCTISIERAVKRVLGVLSVVMNYATRTVLIDFDSKKCTKQHLIKAIQKEGYTATEQGMTRKKVFSGHEHAHEHGSVDNQQAMKLLKFQLVISIFASVLLIIGSMVPWAPALLKNKLFMWILATPIQFWVGWRYYVSSWNALKHKKTNMDVLIALGTSVAYLYSVFVVLFESEIAAAGIPTYVYFEASAAIITFILLGNFLEMRAQGRASVAIKKLVELQPHNARVLRFGRNQEKEWITVSVEAIKF